MYNYPFFSFPHFRRYPSYYPTQYPYVRQPLAQQKQEYLNSNSKSDSYKNYEVGQAKKSNSSNGQKANGSFKKSSSGFSFLGNLLHQEDRSDDEEYFDLFGLKLYNDDLLLIGLIFFLYKEDVKDQYLFFALILLLLS